jgi:hypothetical protein
MPITFDKHGNPKPYGVVELTLKRFVEIFTTIPDKKHRQELIDTFDKYNNDLRQQVNPVVWSQLFGGSYTTLKEKPSDIDVLNILDPTSFERARNLNFFVTRRGSKDKYNVDGYVIPFFGESDPRYQIFVDNYQYWEKWFGTDRKSRTKSVPKVNVI